MQLSGLGGQIRLRGPCSFTGSRPNATSVSRSLVGELSLNACRTYKRHGLASVAPLHAGVFIAVQRFRSDLGLYVHLHCLVTDGAYDEGIADVRFLPAATPTAERMVAVLAQVHEAIAAAAAEVDGLDLDPALAACVPARAWRRRPSRRPGRR